MAGEEVIATTKVRLEPDATGFKEKAADQINKGVPVAAEIPLKVADLTGAQKAALVAAGEARKQLAETRKELDLIDKKLREMTETRKAAEAAGGPILEAFRRQQEEFAKDPQASDEGPLRERAEMLRIQVLLEEQLASAARKRAAEQLAADQQVAASGRKPGVRDRIREVTAGRSAGVGGLLAAGSRLGLVGLAATTAFQAVGELQQSLRVTGDEAFTFEGKIRNAGAELLGGNLIGGLKALAAERKARFEGDLGEKIEAEIKKMKEANDPLIVTEEKLAAVRQKGEKAVQQYVQALLAFDKISIEQAVALLRVNKALEEQAKLTEISATAWANYQAAVEKAGSEVKAFGPDSRGGAQGVGGVEAGRPKGGTSPVFVAGSGGADVAAQIRASINSRIADEQEIASARVREARISQKIAKDSFDTAKKNVQAGAAAAHSAADEWNKYVAATTAVVLATRNAETTAKDAAQAGEALGNAVRDAWAAAITDPALAGAAALKSAKLKEGQAKRDFEAAEKGTKEANEAYGKWQIAKAQTAGVQASMAETAKAEAEAAQASAASAKQASLQNAIAAAELTGDMPALKRAYAAAIAYWKQIRDSTKVTSEAHQAAVGQVINLTASLKNIASTNELRATKLQNDVAEAELKGLDTRPLLLAQQRFAKAAMDNAKEGTLAYEEARGVFLAAAQRTKGANDTLNELKRANARARAALTESEDDDEKLLRAEIRRLNKKVKATKGMGEVHQRAIAQLLQAERELQGMVDEIKPTTTVFDLLTESTKAFVEHAGNVINSSNRFTADSFTGGLRGQIGTSPNAAGRARLGLDDDKITSSLDRNTTATDRLTAAFLRNDSVHGGGGGATGTTFTRGQVVGLRYQAMADRYAEIARAARGGIN